MSVQFTESQAPVAPFTSTGVHLTPGPKKVTVLSSHPLDPLSPDEVTLSESRYTLVLMWMRSVLRLSQFP